MDVNDFVWWCGAICLCVTSVIGMLWLVDRTIEWIIDGFRLRRAFFQWYADKLRKEHDDGR